MTSPSKPADSPGSHRLPTTCRRAAGVLGLIATMALGGCGGPGDPPPLDLPPVERLDSPILTQYILRTVKLGEDWHVELEREGNFQLPLTILASWGHNGGVETWVGGEIRATGEIFSNNPQTGTGADHTYWLRTDSPTPFGAFSEGRYGSEAYLGQTRRLLAKTDAPTYRLTITAIELEAWDGTSAPCPAPDCSRSNYARVMLGVHATHNALVEDGSTKDTPIYDRTILVQLGGWHETWDPYYTDFENIGGKLDKVVTVEFETTPLTPTDRDPRRHARYRLKQPLVIDLPLGDVKEGDSFTVLTQSQVTAQTPRSEMLFRAYFRDPAGGDGITVETTGTQPVDAVAVAKIDPPAVPVCSGAPDPAAGTLQFNVSTLRLTEGGHALIDVVRTSGTRGLVSVALRTVEGSAVGGAHFRPIQQTLRFGDGETGPMPVLLETIDNADVNSERNFTLELADPRGCSALGTPATIQVTLLDNDAPTTFTVGGNVSGLVGSGLTLRNAGDFSTLPVSGNGPFTFPAPLVAGMTYDVQVATQPGSPVQTCRVARGSGTITDANVTSVAVTCDPPATPPGNGALDAAFGSAGRATVAGQGYALAAALQADGKLVLLTDFQRLVRLLPDGSLDPGFGTGGVVNATLSGSGLDQLRAIALQADGGILVAGLARGGTNDDAGVRRYLADGTPDNAFGSGGLARVDFNGLADDARALVVQPDGRIVLAAQAMVTATASDFGIARLNTDGARDASFGTGGKTTAHLAGFDQPAAVSLQADGRIVVAGRTANGGGSTPDTGVLRLMPGGQPDTGFGSGGVTRIALTADWDEAKAVVALPDGRVLLALEARSSPSAQFQQALARLKTDGTPDETFGNQGVSLHAFSPGGDRSRAVAVLADGRIVVAGLARATPSSSTSGDDMLISRHAADGSLDSTFGTGGRLTSDFFGSTDTVLALALRPDGRLVAAGAAFNGGDAGIGVLQLLP